MCSFSSGDNNLHHYLVFLPPFSSYHIFRLKFFSFKNVSLVFFFVLFIIGMRFWHRILWSILKYQKSEGERKPSEDGGGGERVTQNVSIQSLQSVCCTLTHANVCVFVYSARVNYWVDNNNNKPIQRERRIPLISSKPSYLYFYICLFVFAFVFDFVSGWYFFPGDNMVVVLVVVAAAAVRLWISFKFRWCIMRVLLDICKIRFQY